MGLLITTCTNRKRLSPSAELRANSLPSGTVESVAADWVARLARSPDRTPASRLYAGRGFVEASRAAVSLGGDFAILSAGLGLVRSSTLVPSYGLSVVGGSPDSILSNLIGDARSQHWWAQISSKSPFSSNLAGLVRDSTGTILLALSEAYLGLLGPEVALLSEREKERLRLITRTPPERIDPVLRAYLLPYDDRLDGPDSPIRGTRGDFAQRAARHFTEMVLRSIPAGTMQAHASAVRVALSGWRYKPSFDRVRHEDESLLTIMRHHWDEAGGRSTRLLRLLRDDLNIACEQGRFVGLMRRLRHERDLAA